MTDRELLELAAKAAGIENKIWHMHASAFWVDVDSDNPYWNPLTDDGDALRLAVKLNLEISHFTGAAYVASYPHDYSLEGADEPYGDNPYDATRRAIVRAAAEIGKERH